MAVDVAVGRESGVTGTVGGGTVTVALGSGTVRSACAPRSA